MVMNLPAAINIFKRILLFIRSAVNLQFYEKEINNWPSLFIVLRKNNCHFQFTERQFHWLSESKKIKNRNNKFRFFL
jgi:hypothetical protein